jgi:hypothetical protein
MTRSAFWKTLILAIVSLQASASLMAQDAPFECDVTGFNAAPVYKIGRTRRAPDETPALTLLLAVQPAIFNADAMRGLGRALNQRFCRDRTIEAIITDDERAATKWDPFHLPEFYAGAIRASYFLDRNSGQEYIAFSNARGRGFDEFINLARTEEQSTSRTYTGRYQNAKYGYSVVLPDSLAGTSSVPKEREGGISISLSSATNRYIWVGATENSFHFSSLSSATFFQKAWIEADGARILSFNRDRNYRLGNRKGTRLTVTYTVPNSSEIMIKDFVLALKTKQEEVGTFYRLEMATTQKDYTADKKVFEHIIRSWRG